MTKTLTLAELHALITSVLVASNTAHENAFITADALVAAEADGIASHGASRVPFYADQARSGKVDGHATVHVQTTARAVIRVDARDGFAYPAIKAGLNTALKYINDTGIVGVGITHSHHFGVAGYHVESIAEQGYLALGFSNSPAAIAPWGGVRASYGTNPIAFACPRPGTAPLVIDLSLSQVARGKVMLAQKRSETIPADWALDARGNPTTDPEAALAGTMLPLGGAKGAALALMVEILTAALTGSNLASEASSFFTAEGEPPRIGQSFIIRHWRRRR
jgi:(2R)-3-sulfolactate dehydrogenase (NADP+)